MILPQGSLTLIQRPGQQAQLVQTIQQQPQQGQQSQQQQQIRIQQQPQIVKDVWRTTQPQQNQQQTIQVQQQQVVQPVQQRKGLTLSVRIRNFLFARSKARIFNWLSISIANRMNMLPN